jgi:hypothetical protein
MELQGNWHHIMWLNQELEQIEKNYKKFKQTAIMALNIPKQNIHSSFI